MSDDPFQPRPDHELDRLSDEELIAYLREAHRRGHREAAGRALAVLVWGHWRNVERRVALKVPDADVEDVTATVVESAITSAFDGVSEGEFVVWLGTITKRRIADYHRRREHRPDVDSLDATGDEDDRDGHAAVGTTEEDLVETQDAIDRTLAALSPEHRQVVERTLEGYAAREVAEGIPGMTEANVHKIMQRFRDALREALEGGGDTPGSG